MNDQPCKDCTKREIGCHSWCVTYAEFVKWNELKKASIREQKKQRQMLDGYCVDKANRLKKGKVRR